MKKVVRKNQIIITALALLIAVAGYVSYTQTAASVQAVETAADEVADTYEISDEDTVAEIFTDTVIRHLNQREKPIVFMLWGGNAKSKASLITNPQHLILTAAHPSPLSARNGFFGCGHFSRADEFLLENGMKPIRWQIT